MIVNLMATKAEAQNELIKAFKFIESADIHFTCVGIPDRPATAEDIKDIQEQLATVAKDPNMTIVTTQWWPIPLCTCSRCTCARR